MKVVIDGSIPYADEAFATIGEVRSLSPNEIKREGIIDADILVIRTMTKVDEKLLEGTKVKFVATNAVGTDHLALDYLKAKGIGFANAKGCNSNAVAEYVFAALYSLGLNLGFELKGRKIGVVGVGNIGSIVARRAERLGMIVKKNDPPLKRQTGDPNFLHLDDLMDCDIITLHVPLTYEGNDATYRLFNRDRIFQMKPGSILINTSRGAVVETSGLIEAIDKAHLKTAVVDVWENEPDIDVELLRRISIGTPHVAGHTLEGVVTGTWMVYDAVCRNFGLETVWNPEKIINANKKERIRVEDSNQGEVGFIDAVIREVYDIRRDVNDLAMIGVIPEVERPAYFLNLRNNHPLRREFKNYLVELGGGEDSVKNALTALGFEVA
ncbi:MAG TPA: 4-phosphoerythronate dehydrogenase [bacterium (Candidatus Stahlbacteria)]|nr:4-phosphoerythronate dehydrogenase [Candidatus Stahlbacteria bacterium]